MTKTSEVITLFAEHGFLLDEQALSYIKVHNAAEILNLIKKFDPDIVVVSLTAIRRILKSEMKIVINLHVATFIYSDRG